MFRLVSKTTYLWTEYIDSMCLEPCISATIVLLRTTPLIVYRPHLGWTRWHLNKVSYLISSHLISSHLISSHSSHLISSHMIWYYIILYYVMLCYVMLCYVMLCYVMLCYVMLCYVMLYYIILYYLVLSCLCLLLSYLVIHNFSGMWEENTHF